MEIGKHFKKFHINPTCEKGETINTINLMENLKNETVIVLAGAVTAMVI
jgi:hypothetical protein